MHKISQIISINLAIFREIDRTKPSCWLQSKFSSSTNAFKPSTFKWFYKWAKFLAHKDVPPVVFSGACPLNHISLLNLVHFKTPKQRATIGKDSFSSPKNIDGRREQRCRKLADDALHRFSKRRFNVTGLTCHPGRKSARDIGCVKKSKINLHWRHFYGNIICWLNVGKKSHKSSSNLCVRSNGLTQQKTWAQIWY